MSTSPPPPPSADVTASATSEGEAFAQVSLARHVNSLVEDVGDHAPSTPRRRSLAQDTNGDAGDTALRTPELLQERCEGGTKRKRGQHGPRYTGKPKRPKRAANTYKDGHLFESPELQKPIPVPKGKYSLKIPPPTPTKLTYGALATPQDLLKAFDMHDKIDNWNKRAASVEVRAEPSTWTGPLDERSRLVLRTATALAKRVCVILCDNDEAAGTALWDRTRMDTSQRDASVNSKMTAVVAQYYAAAKKSSIEMRTLRACLSTLKRSEIPQLQVKIPNLTIANSSFAQGRADLSLLRSGEQLTKVTRTVQRLDERSLQFVVSSILAGANVSFLSWGVKRVKLGTVTKMLPAITRRRSRTTMYSEYREKAARERPDDNPVSFTTFYRIATALTAGETKMRKAIDYVVGFLVYDAFATLIDIVGDLPEEDQQQMLQELDFCAGYLKYGFDSRILNDAQSSIDPSTPQCTLHRIDYGLDKQARAPFPRPMCENCKSVFRMFDKLTRQVRQANADASTLRVVRDCREKARLYLGHRLRVVNQQQAISRMMDEMRGRCVEAGNSEEAVVIIDYKMKQEPLYYREKTVDHYGKRGMSWHGALVQHFKSDEREPGQFADVVDQRLYYDHISMSDTKQDREAVTSLVECILMRIKQDLPHVKRIVIQADNVSAYQNFFLALVFPYLAIIHGIVISRFIHSETQDGKSMLDAHFARSNQAIRFYVNEGNDCVTPTQVVIALKHNGGLPNCAVELVEHDRSKLKTLLQLIEPLEKRLRRFVKRANDIFFEYTQDFNSSVQLTAPISECVFSSTRALVQGFWSL